jgi:hypothetical protein
MYRINLVALSSNADYQDSPKSNTLVINSGKGPTATMTAEDYSTDDHDLPLKVTGVTETGIHLDWSAFVENQEVAFYKIQWSSVAQPAVSGTVRRNLESGLRAYFPLWFIWVLCLVFV